MRPASGQPAPLFAAHSTNRPPKRAHRALSLDPTLAEAQALLAVVAGHFDYDYEQAKRRFAVAMAREAVAPEIRRDYGYSLLYSGGRPRDAAAQIERALEEDPLNTLSRYLLADCLLAAEAEAEAVAQLRRALEIDSTFWLAHFRLGALHALRGSLDEALACAENTQATGPPLTAALVAGVAARMGDRDRAERLVQHLKESSPYGTRVGLAWYHVVAGEYDRAQSSLQEAVEERDPWALAWGLVYWKVFGSGPLPPRVARMMNLDATVRRSRPASGA